MTQASPLITDEHTVVHALPNVVVQKILAVSDEQFRAFMAEKAAEDAQSWVPPKRKVGVKRLDFILTHRVK